MRRRRQPTVEDEPRVVLFVINAQDPTVLKMKSGLESVLQADGIRLQVVFFHVGGDPPRMRELVDLWNPVGAVVAAEGVDVRNVRIPVVFLDVGFSKNRQNVVYHDSEAMGRLAAKELLAIGNVSFGYVAHPLNLPWVEGRRRAFADVLNLNGFTCSSLRLPSLEMKDRRMVSELKAYLRGLQPPCGILAANDEIAALVIAIAMKLGLSVPDDISVVGIDDNPTYVESGAVSITSIVPDWEKDGRLAGNMLLAHLADPRQKWEKSCSPPIGIIRRASTRRMGNVAHQLVRKALAFIRDRACDGITSADVIRHLGCSRSLANLRFREAMGKSILETIHDVRFRTAADMIASGQLSAQVVAVRCGYRSISFFRSEFKRRMGVSVGEIRREGQGALAD